MSERSDGVPRLLCQKAVDRFPPFPPFPPVLPASPSWEWRSPARPEASDRTSQVRCPPQPFGSRINDAKSGNAGKPRN